MKMTNLVSFSALMFMLLFSSYSFAQHTVNGKNAVGVWKTIDDETGNARSHVQITKNADGTYSGKILKLLNRTPDEEQDPICKVCTDDRKDQKVIGMTIVRDMKMEESYGGRYAKGTILDPKKGKIYDCTIWLTDANTIKVRGWLGPFYRTQTWYRVE